MLNSACYTKTENPGKDPGAILYDLNFFERVAFMLKALQSYVRKGL